MCFEWIMVKIKKSDSHLNFWSASLRQVILLQFTAFYGDLPYGFGGIRVGVWPAMAINKIINKYLVIRDSCEWCMRETTFRKSNR